MTKVVWTTNGPGNMQDTSAAATMPPRIWDGNKSKPRSGGRDPVMTIPRVTCVEISGGARPGKFTFSAHSGVEQPTADPVEYPCGDGQRKAKSQTDEHQLVEIWFGGWSEGICNLRCGEGEVEEHEGADEFAGHGDEMSLEIFGHVFAVEF